MCQAIISGRHAEANRAR